jgi:hypothetical protein
VARQEIPGPPSGRTLRGAGSEVKQIHNYISSIGSKLHEAIGNCNTDLIRSYRRALNSGIARAQEAATREADARGWDAVDGMLQEVEESTSTLLPAAEQILQELEEEARTSWEERAVFYASHVINLGRPERSWDSAPQAGCLRPTGFDRSRGIGDHGMAGLNISTLLVRDPVELLSCTYSGSSAGVTYRGRLELNTQDSVKDVLFWQEMRYPMRGAGGFSNLRRAGGGENRDSPPVQLLEESEYLTVSESASERGRGRRRRSPEDRFSADCEEAGVGVVHRGSEPEPAGHGREGCGPPPDVGHHFGSSQPWAGAVAADRLPIPPRHSASAPLPPRGAQGAQLPRRGKSMQQPRRD